jgi:hypothetical protein
VDEWDAIEEKGTTGPTLYTWQAVVIGLACFATGFVLGRHIDVKIQTRKA